MRTRILTWLFAFLLLGMQQEAQLHALAHIGEGLQRPHDQGLQLPSAETPCAMCALFAGGAAAIPGEGFAADETAAGFAAPQGATSPVAASTFTYYLSRAPPSVV
jgi:hypothetical protein